MGGIYRNVHLKKRQDFDLGSMSQGLTADMKDIEGVFRQLAEAFNGIRSDLVATNERIKKTREGMGRLIVEVRNIIGCEVSHVIVELGETVADVEDEKKYLKLIAKINKIENPFTRMAKLDDVDALLVEAIGNRKHKCDEMHQRLMLSDGVQTPENVTVMKLIEKVEFVVAGLKERRNCLTALRSRLWANMDAKMAKCKPVVEFEK